MTIANPPISRKRRIRVTLFGTVSYGASRTFLVDVTLDADIGSFNTGVLVDLADEARIAWEFSKDGYVEVENHAVEEIHEEESLLAEAVQLDGSQPGE